MKQWLSHSIMTLRTGSNNIDDFVKQQKALKQIEHMFSPIKEKIKTIGQQYMILQQKRFRFEKDDNQNYNDLIQQ